MAYLPMLHSQYLKNPSSMHHPSKFFIKSGFALLGSVLVASQHILSYVTTITTSSLLVQSMSLLLDQRQHSKEYSGQWWLQEKQETLFL